MASQTSTSAALFLAINLLFFTIASACGTCGGGVTPKPPTPKPPTPKPSTGKCPVDTLKLAVCANVVTGLVDLNFGGGKKTPCCSLLTGLTNVDAALCLCTALKANVLGIVSSVPLDISLLLNYCGKKSPQGFQCA